MSVDVDLRELAQPARTEHFTGADLKALLYNAQLQAAHALLDEQEAEEDLLNSGSHLSITSESVSSLDTSVTFKVPDGPMTFTWSEETGRVESQEISKEMEAKVKIVQHLYIKDTHS